jgi:predicted ATPase
MSPITGEALLERDRELTLLSTALDRAHAGVGSLALVEGVPGIGKTALLGALRSRSAASGITALAARAGELEQGFPFGVARQLLERAVRRELSGVEPVSLMAGPAARTRALFGATDAFTGRADEGRSQAMLYSLYWLIANLGERGPLAIVVDDAHWSDVASLRLLDVLVRRLEELPAARSPAPMRSLLPSGEWLSWRRRA